MYRKIVLSGVTAAAILGAGTAALATTGSSATTGTPTPSSGSSASHAKSAKAGKHTKGKRSVLKRAAHAEFTIKTKDGYVTHDLIKGAVTAVSATSITVQAGDKTSETYAIGTGTKVSARATTKGSKPSSSSIDKVTTGQQVVVTGTGTSTLSATRVVDLGSK